MYKKSAVHAFVMRSFFVSLNKAELYWKFKGAELQLESNTTSFGNFVTRKIISQGENRLKLEEKKYSHFIALLLISVTSTNFQLIKSFLFVPTNHDSGAEFPHRQTIGDFHEEIRFVLVLRTVSNWD